MKFYVLFLLFCRKILHRDLKSKNIFLKNNLLKIGMILKHMCSRNVGEYILGVIKYIALSDIVPRSVNHWCILTSETFVSTWLEPTKPNYFVSEYLI